MVLSSREKYIAIGTAAAVAILVLDQLALSPYLARRTAINTERAQVMEDLNKANDLFTRQRKLRNVWANIEKGGLKVDSSAAESQALQAVLDWAQSAGVELAAIKPERSTQEKWFQVIRFHVTANGPMASISRLLWSLETAAIPVRVNDVQIIPRREGTDDLTVQLGVSTLCLLPDSDKTGKTTVTLARGGNAP